MLLDTNIHLTSLRGDSLMPAQEHRFVYCLEDAHRINKWNNAELDHVL